MPIGEPKDEYKDLSDNMRQYANMRFAQLTLFVALTAGILSATFAANPPLASPTKFVLKIGGFMVAAIFWIMEERAADYWHHFRRRAIELEKELGYQQYSTRPARKIVTATNAVRLLFALTNLFWVATLIWHSAF